MKNKEPTRRSSRIPKNNDEENLSYTGRKRKNSSPAIASPKIQKKTDKERKTDGYCWICHQVGYDLNCSSCPRVYHSSCVKKKHLPFNASGSCGECQAQFLSKGNATPIMHKHSLSELLELVMQEALKEDVKKNNQKSQPRSNESKFWKYFETWPEISNLCQIIDLSILIDKLKKKHYLTTAEFFSDVKWIYHNCYILHKVDSDITETALKLEKNFKKELLDLEACSECYFNKHSKDSHQSNFFTMVCEIPHDIVWAKLRGSPYWPAKCMKIYNGHADVSFFGTHDKSSIQLSQCYRISQKSPNDKEIKQSKYLDAVTELSIYVSNYRVIYNSFPYYPYRTPLVDSKASTLKKSNKKGRHRRSPSDKQLDDSYNLEKCTASDEPVKSIKGVPIDGPVISIKGKNCCVILEPQCGLFSHLVSDYESVNSIRGVQANSSTDSSLYSNHCETDSAELSSKRNNPSEQVAVCMTFTTDDETGPYNQMNAPSKLVNVSPVESSVPVGYSTPITSCSPVMIGSPNFLHSADELEKSKLNSCSETTLQNDSPHFVNSGSSNLLPMITSVSAEAALNSTFTPEEPVSYSNESVIPEASEIIHNYPNLFSEQGKELSGNSVLIEDDDDDDDIIVLKQDPPKENKAVNKILNNSKMAHALSQILSSNKPHLQHLYSEFLDFGVKSFLKVWLSSTLKKHDENEILAFYQLYDQLHQKYDELLKENESLKQVATTLKQENELLNGKVAEMRVEVDKANLRINNAGRVVSLMSMSSNKSKQPEVHQLEKLQSQHISDLKEIQALKEKLHEFENNLLERDNMENHQLGKLQSQHDLDLKKIEILEEKLRDFENNLLLKDNEVKECKERVLELEDQLKTLLEKASCTTSECQTSLSDLPDNEMYTLKELEEFKKTCEEQSNYKHTKQSKDDDCSDSEYEVTRRTVTKRTTSLIEVDENGMVINPGTPHIFGNTSFSMEYAMGPPFTVVSSSLPSAVILNPEYVSQQSSITSSSSTPKRNRSKKKNSHHNRN